MLTHDVSPAASDDPDLPPILIRAATYRLGGRRLPSPVRRRAAEVMGRLGRSRPELQPAFARALALVLGGIESWPTRFADEVRHAALDALAEFGPAAHDAIPALRHLAADPSEPYHALALAALHTIAADS
jgi:hypothetical protein